jgi:hypothetical protein
MHNSEPPCADMTEEEWQESCRKHQRKMEQERAYAWSQFHRDQIRRHTQNFQCLIAYHRRQLGDHDT